MDATPSTLILSLSSRNSRIPHKNVLFRALRSNLFPPLLLAYLVDLYYCKSAFFSNRETLSSRNLRVESNRFLSHRYLPTSTSRKSPERTEARYSSTRSQQIGELITASSLALFAAELFLDLLPPVAYRPQLLCS